MRTVLALPGHSLVTCMPWLMAGTQGNKRHGIMHVRPICINYGLSVPLAYSVTGSAECLQDMYAWTTGRFHTGFHDFHLSVSDVTAIIVNSWDIICSEPDVLNSYCTGTNACIDTHMLPSWLYISSITDTMQNREVYGS